MDRSTLVLVAMGGCMLGLSLWRRHVIRDIAAYLATTGDPDSLPLPTGLTVWRADWRVYDSVTDVQLRRLLTRCRRLGIAMVVVVLVGFAMYAVV
jgi:hypothetical protein